MPSSLHVSLPDELRAFVDQRTNGRKDFATPSEYVRDLIRKDMAVQKERDFVFGQLLKSADDIKHGRLISSEEIEEGSKRFLDELDAEDD
jgi:antitoxin ParD1/3/4